MDLHGIGIGQGIVVGRVLRMPEPLPEPAETPSALTPADEGARATAGLSAVALDLAARGGAGRRHRQGRARGAGDDGGGPR